MTSEVEELVWARCATPECRGARLADEEQCLRHADPKARRAYLTRVQRGRTIDARGVVIDIALWQQIVDALPRDAAGRIRFPRSDFDGAVIEADVDLDEAQFSRHALFHRTRFRRPVSMRGTRVFGQSRFSAAVFEGPVVFADARLNGPSWFAGARFEREVSFEGTLFGGQASFSDAVFNEDVIFKESTFGNYSEFDRVTFGCHADLSAAICEADTSFVGATFANPPAVDGAVFKGKQGVPNVAARRPVRWWGRPLAAWSQRAHAAVLDLLVPVLIVAVGFAASPLLHALEHNEIAVVVQIACAAAAVGFILRELIIQGREGQTWGKRRVGLRLVSERHRGPIGPMRSILRYLLHGLDSLPLFAGWFWPLRSEKHQTFADRLMGTVVVVVGESFQRTNAAGAPPQLASAGFG